MRSHEERTGLSSAIGINLERTTFEKNWKPDTIVLGHILVANQRVVCRKVPSVIDNQDHIREGRNLVVVATVTRSLSSHYVMTLQNGWVIPDSKDEKMGYSTGVYLPRVIHVHASSDEHHN